MVACPPVRRERKKRKKKKEEEEGQYAKRSIEILQKRRLRLLDKPRK